MIETKNEFEIEKMTKKNESRTKTDIRGETERWREREKTITVIQSFMIE